MAAANPCPHCGDDGYTETWNDDQTDVVITLCPCGATPGETFPPEIAISRENGGGGNRTRVTCPADSPLSSENALGSDDEPPRERFVTTPVGPWVSVVAGQVWRRPGYYATVTRLRAPEDSTDVLAQLVEIDLVTGCFTTREISCEELRAEHVLIFDATLTDPWVVDACRAREPKASSTTEGTGSFGA